MEENINVKEENKFSYEELENFARQLDQQAQSLYRKLQEQQLQNAFQRLNFLFKVIENSVAFDVEFVEKCVKEIQDIMTIPEQEETQETEE